MKVDSLLTHDGTIVLLKLKDGYGFIRSPRFDKNIWFHCQQLIDMRFDEQLQERRVRFEILSADKGLRALNVRPAD